MGKKVATTQTTATR